MFVAVGFVVGVSVGVDEVLRVYAAFPVDVGQDNTFTYCHDHGVLLLLLLLFFFFFL